MLKFYSPVPENEKAVNEIYYSTFILGNMILDSLQKSVLIPIALQCPYNGGSAVTKARNMLYCVGDTMIYDDDSLCGDVGIAPRIEDAKQNAHEQHVSLYPNPSNGTLNNSFLSPLQTIADLKVYNIMGEILYETDIPASTLLYEVRIPSNVNDVCYISINLDLEKPIQRKLTIIK